MIKLFLALFICFISATSDCQQSIDFEKGDMDVNLKQLLPSGRIEMAIMAFQMPIGYNDLLTKIQAGINSHREWYAQYIREAHSGQSPAYHPNLGVSEEEWNTFVQLSGQLQMVRTDSGYIEVVQTDSTLELKGQGNTEGFDGLKIQLKTNKLSTSFDSWNYTQVIQPNPDQKLTGLWNGYNWKYQEMDTTNLSDLTKIKGKDYSFSIGQLAESKRGIIIYKAREFLDGQQYRMADLLVTYEIPMHRK